MNLRNNVTRGAVQINVNFPNRVNVYDYKVRVMAFNNDFNNISVISWRSVLLAEETGVP
jgi:hypothetical protein